MARNLFHQKMLRRIDARTGRDGPRTPSIHIPQEPAQNRKRQKESVRSLFRRLGSKLAADEKERVKNVVPHTLTFGPIKVIVGR